MIWLEWESTSWNEDCLKDAVGMISTAAMPVLLYREVVAPRARRGGSITAAECPLPELRHEDVPPPTFSLACLISWSRFLDVRIYLHQPAGPFFFPSFIRSPVS